MQTIARRSHPVNSSDSLTVANTRLHALREQMQQTRSGETSAVLERSAATNKQPPVSLPTHLGWGSERVSIVSDSTQPEKPVKPTLQIEIVPDVCESDVQQAVPEQPQTLVVHPSLLVALLKHEVAAVGRIWLLCRYLDTQGRGCLTVDELRAQLTAKDSPLYVCGWRRLRQILQQGKGIFWQRDDAGRLWLVSTVKVAATLAVTRFSGDAVELPVSELLGSIGAVRTAFYTTFHCGRDSSPISRATLATATGVPERTQRLYDNAAATERISNFSLIAPAGDKETYWQHGRAAFTFTDKQGQQGTAGCTYTAIRLPNSYNTTRYAALHPKRKRLNRRLKQILVQRGTQGNGFSPFQRLFFTDGNRAARAFNRNDDTFLRQQRSGSSVFWAGWVH